MENRSGLELELGEKIIRVKWKATLTPQEPKVRNHGIMDPNRWTV